MKASEEGSGEAPVEVGAVLERIGGNPGLLIEMVEIFLLEYPERLTALRNAVRAERAAEIEAAAHGIRSALQFFGAEGASGLARELEALGRAGSVHQAPSVLARFEPEMERIFRFFTDPRWRERM